MLSSGGGHFVHITQSAKFKCGSCLASPRLFYGICRFLAGCKTMPIFRNVLKSDTNKGYILGYNERWSFSMEFYSKTSKLP